MSTRPPPLVPLPAELPADAGDPMDPSPGRFPRVDALFAGEPPPPPREAAPLIRRLKLTLAVAVPLDLLGIPCWTGVPGAAITLYAWLLADEEVVRVDEGVYEPDAAEELLRLRAIARWALYFSVVSFFLQGLLLATSFYDTWFATLLRLF